MKNHNSSEFDRDGTKKKKFVSHGRALSIKRKNKQRLGGGGLSLEAFANAKVKNNGYNPALINPLTTGLLSSLEKQREFYRNAKYVSKFKKSMKQRDAQQSNHSISENVLQDTEAGTSRKEQKKNKKHNSYSLNKLYETKHEEQEKAKMEREAQIQAKKEEREKAMAQKKAWREKMLKKTRSGQPVMKYRVEHILESLQNSVN
ncbi:hypothetical protein Sjap_006751 [Stephania japonica]|uniref:rRNA-processing protein FYV7 n=1 Tax=Stephania japonica TaxID=461633 RepID=A0AAP0K6F0_9MAGN